MKKFFSLLLILIMLITMSGFSFAEPNKNNEETVVKKLTYNEYIEKLANSLGVSVNEAIKIDQKENEKYEKELKRRFPKLFNKVGINIYGVTRDDGHYTYYTITKTKWYNSDFAAYVGATFKIYVNGSFREFVSIKGKVFSERKEGVGNYDWNPLNSWDDPKGGKYPTTSVTIGATGTFRTEIKRSQTVGIDFAGFSLQQTIGDTLIYISKPMTITYTYNLY
ncbi:hypothetical protein [Caloranaerobacter azorensis]|uniref:Uncharacterized protein n=1 Tax=Caloranaerobacter azorensis TaxID=116090 RepID=A0A6P1YFY4_9FIRM|nr:hypothetical protein [Caloranaerobacter azorensis]QIB28017.1 hypothetical protein G3A45_12470 [Caloranaerobacter azorensis]